MTSDSEESEQEEYDVEAIRDWRYHRQDKRREFLIKWRNWDESTNTWEPEEHLNCPEPMKLFRNSLSKKRKKFLDCEHPENLTGLQRNAEIKSITADIPENRSSGQKFCLLVVFDDDDGDAEEIEFRELCRARPKEAFKFCEQRLISRDALKRFASLLEQIDKRVLVLLRDGRSLFGVLRSIDQFANLVLHLTVERIYIGDEYGEIDRGVFLIRGENVVLCGELDDDSDSHPEGFTKVPIEVILSNQARSAEEKSNRDMLKQKALQERGMLMHADGLADDM